MQRVDIISVLSSTSCECEGPVYRKCLVTVLDSRGGSCDGTTVLYTNSNDPNPKTTPIQEGTTTLSGAAIESVGSSHVMTKARTSNIKIGVRLAFPV